VIQILGGFIAMKKAEHRSQLQDDNGETAN
jgi:hypothetical protein